MKNQSGRKSSHTATVRTRQVRPPEKDEETNANWGFLDQQKSLSWIYDNIENFNGDKKRITVAGQSAGGISTNLHQINPKSRAG